MGKDKTVYTRIEESKKMEFEKLLATLGLTTSYAIRMFINQAIIEQAIPFKIHIPNKETLGAFKEAEHLDNLDTYETFGDLRKEVGV